MKLKYYLNFIPEADVNYFYLFSLTELAEYNTNTKSYDTIKYISIPKLAEKLKISSSTLNRILDKDDYKRFLSIDKLSKKIILKNNFIKSSGNNCFICLTTNEVQFLKEYNDNLLCKYYIYMKYWCSHAQKTNNKQDFTANQFLTAIGYSTKSKSQLERISKYNSLLVSRKIISISTYRDDLGHKRNLYKFL